MESVHSCCAIRWRENPDGASTGTPRLLAATIIGKRRRGGAYRRSGRRHDSRDRGAIRDLLVAFEHTLERHDRSRERARIELSLLEQLDEARDVAHRATAAGLAAVMRHAAERE